MEPLTTALLLFTLAVILIGIPTLLILNARRFRNEAIIFRQNGDEFNDVLIMRDKFAVQNIDGAWHIQFKKMREKTRSLDGKYWTTFVKRGKESVVLKYTRDEWANLNMSSKISRGLLLYETTEGEFYPMRIHEREGKFEFSILDQDNRQYVISETQNINDLTRNRKKELTVLWGIIIGIVAIVVIGMGIMYFLNRAHDANIQQTASICQFFAREAINQTVHAGNTFIQDIAGNLGG